MGGWGREIKRYSLPPRSLAFDGKSIGEDKCAMIITLCRHEDG
jgi:hypothetical protein